MKYNPIYFFDSDSDCYIAAYPELNGCSAAGDTIDEALENLKDAADLWLGVNSERGFDTPKCLSDIEDQTSNPTNVDVASYILSRTGKISTYALQKLMYFCQAWSYGWRGKELFEGEFQAWWNGPVNPPMFQKFRGRMLVSEGDLLHEHHNFSEIERHIMDMVLTVYDEFDGDELSEISHKDEPWVIGRRGLAPNDKGNRVIKPDDMKSYYGKQI